MGKSIGIMAVIGVCALVCRGQTLQPEERGLWDVWCVGTNSGFVAEESLKACIAFTARTPRDPFVLVMSGFAAWHHLKNGNTEMAVRLFESMQTEKPVTALQKAGDQMARTWLTRLDRERVAHALKKAYLRDIAFPPTLEALKVEGDDAARPPLTDRWGKPWAYRLSSSIQGMAAHRYVLESPGLGADSDLRNALKRPYADGIQLRALRMAAGITDTVEFANPDGVSVRRRLGQEMSGGTLVYLGARLLLLSDGNHWRVLPRPR